ncbi:transposase [Undibacterium luofuense]|uniref:Transposase n=1 Tax=Undibacterium luofuense TaxID=2828733 RepID=A0A941DSV6_9BURK|nr:transposase [Undibacterium luofuense]MBR7784221.1 transposase [Undibacterium luofuense]
MERCLTNKQRHTFSTEFKLQAACLVLDQGYSHVKAIRSVGIGESVLRRWLQQLQLERQGVSHRTRPSDQINSEHRNLRRALSVLSERRPF